MEIDELQAGRELDALIAEEVMGWHNITRWKDGEISGCHEGADYQLLELPHYSTDIAAAWEVHLEACSWLFSKRKRYLEELQKQTRTVDGELVAWPDVLIVLRDRMPEAICLATLKAIGCSVS